MWLNPGRRAAPLLVVVVAEVERGYECAGRRPETAANKSPYAASSGRSGTGMGGPTSGDGGCTADAVEAVEDVGAEEAMPVEAVAEEEEEEEKWEWMSA